MRADSLGFFWEDEDHKNARKKAKLAEHNWIEVVPGYWIEKIWLDDDDIDPFECCMRLDEAYNVVKNVKEKREPPYRSGCNQNG